MWLLDVLVGVVGLVVGSFLNVVIWRVPRGESVVSPPSHCPRCDHEVRKRDNVPVVSWLLLRGRCRDCGAPISARYPAVELGTALLFLVAALRFGLDPVLPAYLYLAAISVALAMIDVDVQRLPFAIVNPSYAVVAALLALGAWQGDWGWHALLRALYGAIVLYLVYTVPDLLYALLRGRSGMGGGDKRLAPVLGAALAFLGWGPFVIGAFLGFALGALQGIPTMLARRAGWQMRIPFGPFMLLGAWIAVVCGQQLWDAYLGAVT